jgi:hypothetical protein
MMSDLNHRLSAHIERESLVSDPRRALTQNRLKTSNVTVSESDVEQESGDQQAAAPAAFKRFDVPKTQTAPLTAESDAAADREDKEEHKEHEEDGPHVSGNEEN